MMHSLISSFAKPFRVQLAYFVLLSLVGFLALKLSTPKATSFVLGDIDVFFTSVSAVTVSSMSTLEMEVFSNTQLIIISILMFVGGEVFTSMLGLHLQRYWPSIRINGFRNRINMGNTSSDSFDKMELGSVNEKSVSSTNVQDLKDKSAKFLGNVVLSYLVVVHVVGSSLVLLYMSLVPSASQVLNKKGLRTLTFSIFTTISTFANCGFIPTNENMVVFKKNSGLLLVLIPQILMGNTLYPLCLWVLIRILERVTKRVEFGYLLENWRELRYSHLLPRMRCFLLGATVFGFILGQWILFCPLEWKSQVTEGLNVHEKLVGSLFQVVNSRHAGESVFDLSTVSPAILVLFVVMMYLPPYTSFLPMEARENSSTTEKKSRTQEKNHVEYLLFSQLSYVVIFTILVCITERGKLRVSDLEPAYGNVGFSVGYSCGRQINPEKHCKDKLYGFAGRWSNKGKLILVLVMFFGRLKKFSMRGGRAWKLS
ncbi:hypothetical protein RJ640_007745 [Escallonia rubra]|uniref:Uncharacterized protein n=1 Tax=Escallonia rubra TaxID=112253 RepID=A0AA88UD80_9ASTE|nr:hypothetical protein RJ640_007745 [Escallonia rubra]